MRAPHDQRVQIVEQTGVRFRQRFASPSRTANATELHRRRRVEFLQAASDRARGDPRDAGNRTYPAMPRRPGYRRSEKPSLPFIQLRPVEAISLHCASGQSDAGDSANSHFRGVSPLIAE
jgi:hypothetical protein